MKELYLTRHGQTEWNVCKRLQGQCDSPLTAKGREDARRLGEAMKDTPIDRVISSDLLRARQTAELIAAGRLPVETDPRLREIHMGDWEGVYLSALATSDPVGHELFAQGSPEFHPPNGESLRDVWARTASFLEELVQCDAESILLVTHGKTQAMLLEQLQGRAFGAPTRVLTGTALTHFSYANGRFVLRTLGSTDHMVEHQ